MELQTKLQMKSDQVLECVNAPDTLDLPGDTALADSTGQLRAVLVFVQDSKILAKNENDIVATAAKDSLTLVAYFKAGQLDTDLNRDSLAHALQQRGIEPVRQVSINSVWCALRFRPMTSS